MVLILYLIVYLLWIPSYSVNEAEAATIKCILGENFLITEFEEIEAPKAFTTALQKGTLRIFYVRPRGTHIKVDPSMSKVLSEHKIRSLLFLSIA